MQRRKPVSQYSISSNTNQAQDCGFPVETRGTSHMAGYILGIVIAPGSPVRARARGFAAVSGAHGFLELVSALRPCGPFSSRLFMMVQNSNLCTTFSQHPRTPRSDPGFGTWTPWNRSEEASNPRFKQTPVSWRQPTTHGLECSSHIGNYFMLSSPKSARGASVVAARKPRTCCTV